MASLFPISFYGRQSGHKYVSWRVGFCPNGSHICIGVFFTAKGGLVHFDNIMIEKLSISVKDIQTWLADPQNNVLQTPCWPMRYVGRRDDQFLAILKLEIFLLRGG